MPLPYGLPSELLTGGEEACFLFTGHFHSRSLAPPFCDDLLGTAAGTGPVWRMARVPTLVLSCPACPHATPRLGTSSARFLSRISGFLAPDKHREKRYQRNRRKKETKDEQILALGQGQPRNNAYLTQLTGSPRHSCSLPAGARLGSLDEREGTTWAKTALLSPH